MADVERLDFKKQPPWYTITGQPENGWWWTERVTGEAGLTPSYPSHGEALAAAWAHYKARNDPPGMEVRALAVWQESVFWVYRAGVQLIGPFACSTSVDEWRRTETKARAAAWAWYETRLAVADRVESLLAPGVVSADVAEPWPRCLTWTDDQVAAVERWRHKPVPNEHDERLDCELEPLAWMPEVLRG